LPPAASGALQRLMPRRWWHTAAGQASAWLHVTLCACQRPDGAVGSQVAARSCCSSPRLVGSSAACPPRPGACSAGSGRVGGAAGSRSGRRAALAPPSRPAGEPVVVHAAGLECSTGPSVESSRNRAVIWAGVALGTGIGSGICVPFPGRTARDPMSSCGAIVPRWLTSPPQGSVVPEWASSVAGRMDGVPCVTIWPWTASWPSPETARQPPVP
jgi:hypothetical protein